MTKPSYYKRKFNNFDIEVKDITHLWNLDSDEAQAIQYILRAKYKNNGENEIEDLQKAIDMLRMAVAWKKDKQSSKNEKNTRNKVEETFKKYSKDHKWKEGTDNFYIGFDEKIKQFIVFPTRMINLGRICFATKEDAVQAFNAIEDKDLMAYFGKDVE